MLLDIVEDIIPAGGNAWILVSLEAVDTFNGKDKTWCRVGTACKAKFENMALLTVPTGCTEMPLHIKRAR